MRSNKHNRMLPDSTNTLPYNRQHLRASANSRSHHQKRRLHRTMADDRIDRWHAARGKGVVLLGGTIYRSFISAHFLLSAYFLTTQTYKRMCLLKYYRANPLAQLLKHIKSLQGDIGHAIMKPETSLNWSSHKNVHCMRLHNYYTCVCLAFCNLPARQIMY